MTEETVKLDINLTQDETWDLNLMMKKINHILPFIYFLFGIGLIFMLLPVLQVLDALIVFLLYALMVALLIKVYPLISKLYSNSNYKKQGVENFFSTCEFTKSIIEVHSPNFSCQKPWNEVNRFYETDLIFLIFIKKLNGFVIPKRCFGKSQELEMFRQCLTQIPPQPQDNMDWKLFIRQNSRLLLIFIVLLVFIFLIEYVLIAAFIIPQLY